MKKQLTLMLCALAAILCLSGCNSKTGDIPTPTETEPASETTANEAALPSLKIVADGATEYKVVRPDTASETVTQASMALRTAISESCGVNMGITTDFEKRGTDPATRYPYEIVVGATNREETAQATGMIRYNDAIIAVIGTRLVITGGSDEATAAAVEHFIAQYLKGPDLMLEDGLRDIQAASYPKDKLTLGGADISEYTIIYANGFRDAANAVADRIGDACGAIMKTGTVKDTKNGREIVIGSTSRGTVTLEGDYDSFAVSVKDTDLYITGGSTTSVETGCAKMLERLLADGTESLALTDVTLTYTRPDRQTYIDDISKFALNWELYFDTPDWMLDYDEKYAAMLDADGRLMSCLHRGDMAMYPENSIEGIISSVMLGGDMVEIDPRRTKDGVLVLLHDATLTRTTDYSEKAGKNGLPTSAKVADWTYDQLMQLNLKDGTGGTNARVTAYKIPTLEEAFKVCANRIFIRLDVKGDDSGKIFWDYEKDIWPLMTKYKSYTNVIYTWHAAFTNSNYALVRKYNALQKELCGKTAMHFIKGSGSGTAHGILKTIEADPNVFTPTIRLTDFDLSKTGYKSYIVYNSAKLAGLKGEVRIYVDAHGTNADFPENKEGAEMYAALNNAGINVLLVNNGYRLCTYIAEHFEPTQK